MEGDKIRNISTVALKHGPKAASQLSALFYLAAVGLSPVPWLLNIVSWPYILLVAPTDAGFIASAFILLKDYSKENAFKGEENSPPLDAARTYLIRGRCHLVKTYETVRGMRDFLPEDLAKRRRIEDEVRRIFTLYGYGEIETPLVESFALLSAKAGEEIRHRMYEFKDLGGRRIALRPEMTASVARIVATKLRSEPKPLRLGYVSNCFRYDNPQMGRYREFWQAGYELFGSNKPEADVEILTICYDLLT